MVIGTYAELSLAKARETARELMTWPERNKSARPPPWPR